MSRPVLYRSDGPLGQRLEADPLELAGDGVVDLAERARLGGRDLVHHLGPRVAAERLRPVSSS